MIEVNENKLIELINDEYHLDLINKNPLGLSSEDLEKLKVAMGSCSNERIDFTKTLIDFYEILLDKDLFKIKEK